MPVQSGRRTAHRLHCAVCILHGPLSVGHWAGCRPAGKLPRALHFCRSLPPAAHWLPAGRKTLHLAADMIPQQQATTSNNRLATGKQPPPSSGAIKLDRIEVARIEPNQSQSEADRMGWPCNKWPCKTIALSLSLLPAPLLGRPILPDPKLWLHIQNSPTQFAFTACVLQTTIRNSSNYSPKTTAQFGFFSLVSCFSAAWQKIANQASKLYSHLPIILRLACLQLAGQNDAKIMLPRGALFCLFCRLLALGFEGAKQKRLAAEQNCRSLVKFY